MERSRTNDGKSNSPPRGGDLISRVSEHHLVTVALSLNDSGRIRCTAPSVITRPSSTAAMTMRAMSNRIS
jgi:hypothetical protein